MAKKTTTPEPAVEQKATKPKVMSRMVAAALAVKSMNGVTTMDALAHAADALVVEAGGTTDLNKARDCIKFVLPITEALGLVDVKVVHETTIVPRAS